MEQRKTFGVLRDIKNGEFNDNWRDDAHPESVKKVSLCHKQFRVHEIAFQVYIHI